MKALRKIIRNLVMEACKRPEYFGAAGSGVVLVCTEDSSVFLQQRSMRVMGGRGQWAFPGGAYHPIPDNPVYHTPIQKRFQVDPDDPALKKNAFKELEEEAGRNGLPPYYIIEELISYEDCGFIYKTYIADVDLQDKLNWQPEPKPDCSWEVANHGWFHKDDWQKQDLFFGFTPILVDAINGNLI